MKKFKVSSVDPYERDADGKIVRRLSRKELAAKRRLAYEEYQKRVEIEQVISMETNRNERNAWKCRSYMANKLRQ